MRHLLISKSLFHLTFCDVNDRLGPVISSAHLAMARTVVGRMRGPEPSLSIVSQHQAPILGHFGWRMGARGEVGSKKADSDSDKLRFKS